MSNQSGLKNWFRRLFGSDKKSGSSTAQKGAEDTNDVYTKLMDDLKRMGTASYDPEIEKEYKLAVEDMANTGFTDGVFGIKNVRDKEIKEIAESHSKRIVDRARDVLSGKLTQAKTKLDSQETIKNRDERNDRLQHQYYEYLQYYYRFHSRVFSSLLFLFYFVIAILLIIADVPLALKLIQNGFDLPQPDSHAISSLFTNPDGFWTTLLANWETFFTAVGISLCTVYIKIFYDEFIGHSYGAKVVSREKFRSLLQGFVVEGENQNNEITQRLQQADKENLFAKIIKTVIFLFTLGAIVVLAIFRINTLELIQTLTLPRGIFMPTTIAITLLFPLISGICLSLAITCLQNMNRFNEAGKECKRSLKEYTTSLKEFTELQRVYSDLESEKARWDDKENCLQKFTAIFLSYYDRAYKIGMVNPDHGHAGLDFFKKMDLWREKMVSRKTWSTLYQTSLS